MFGATMEILKKKILKAEAGLIPINWIRKENNSWLAREFPQKRILPEKTAYSEKIEGLASETNAAGPQPLWEGYGDNDAFGQTRIPNSVRTTAAMGNLYSLLVERKKPDIVVEFGTAFGVSGMYFLAGINNNDKGQLLTFEPNEVWAKMARYNLSQISHRFTLTVGTFEDNIKTALQEECCIGMAFIDAIHTKEFVIPQLDIVVANCCSKAIILLDDINFSESMRECWREVAVDERFASVATFGDRVGVLELQ